MSILEKDRVFIIAEAGVNHDGEINKGLRLVDIAADANADAVKFQTFKPGEITGRFTPNVEYLEGKSKLSRYELSASLALPYEDFRTLQDYSEKKGIQFLSTPDGIESLNFLVDELAMPIIKIGSTEITHLEFLAAAASKGKPIILSTGLSTLGEVEKAYRTLQENGATEVTILQCTSEYPAPDEDVNLRAMCTIADAFKCPVGFSDHSVGRQAAIAAVALGASVVEKHFTESTSAIGPDHQASLGPEDLALLVLDIRRAERMLGDGVKIPRESELKNIEGVRRGVVAAMPIDAGTILLREHIAYKRPFVGVNPEQAALMLGRTLNTGLELDEPILWGYLD